MVWATGVVNIMCQEKDGHGRVSRKMTWATGVVNITCQEKDDLGY